MGKVKDIDIANLALGRLTDNTITSFSDDSKEARKINACFSILRDSLLESADWSFASKVLPLNKVVGVPAVEFRFAYKLPQDYLRLVKYSVTDADSVSSIGTFSTFDISGYFIEGDLLLTDVDNLIIKYVSGNVSSYSNSFAVALASKISAWLSPDFGDGSVEHLSFMSKEAEGLKRSAKSSNIKSATNQFRRAKRRYGS